MPRGARADAARQANRAPADVLAETVATALGRPLHQGTSKSTTKAQQALRIRRGVAPARSQLGGRPRRHIANYIKRGVLWEAFESDERVVVLNDEIDKPISEFPNDLLRELDRWIPTSTRPPDIVAKHRPARRDHVDNEGAARTRSCGAASSLHPFPDRDTKTQIVDVLFPVSRRHCSRRR